MITPERCTHCKWLDMYGGCKPPGLPLRSAALVGFKFCPLFEQRIGRRF